MTAVARAVALAPPKKKIPGIRPNVSGPGLLHLQKSAWAACATHDKRKHQRWQGRWPPLFPKDSNPPTQASKKERNRKKKKPKTSRPTMVAGAVAPACKEKQNPRGKAKHAQPEEQKDRQGHFAPTLATPVRSHPQPGAPSMSKSQPLPTESRPRQPTRNSQKKGGRKHAEPEKTGTTS